MEKIIGILGALAAVAAVFWPQIKGKLPGLLRGVGSGTTTAVPAGAPECLTNPAAVPPEWVAAWVDAVQKEAPSLPAQFSIDRMLDGSSLYAVAQKARDYNLNAKKPVTP